MLVWFVCLFVCFSVTGSLGYIDIISNQLNIHLVCGSVIPSQNVVTVNANKIFGDIFFFNLAKKKRLAIFVHHF